MSDRFSGIGAALRAYANKDGRGYPDWALRYAPIARGLSHAANARIVEIGANQASFARFTGTTTLLIDLDRAALVAARAVSSARAIVADATSLALPDACCDAVLCIDTLEHIPEALRDTVLREIVRVLKPSGIAVISFPSGSAATDAEARIRDAYFQSTGDHLRWLEEHAAEGLPNVERVVSTFAAAAPRRAVKVEPNANIRVWEWIWRVMIGGWPGRGNAIAQVLLRVVTPLLTRIHVGTCYRTMIWLQPEEGRR